MSACAGRSASCAMGPGLHHLSAGRRLREGDKHYSGQRTVYLLAGSDTLRGCCSPHSIPDWYLAFPVVRQWDVVIWPTDFPAVVHECVEVREVAVQVHSIGIVPPCQVPVAVWALQGKGATQQ